MDLNMTDYIPMDGATVEMETTLDILTKEIRRVVTSPYPTQLKTLHDIAARTRGHEIVAWAASHPCQISPLATAVLEALPRWPYALHLITSLCYAVDIRDAFLRAEPLLLDRLITEAVDGQGSRERYIQASMALLRYALPDDISLPLSAQSLLVATFKHAADSPQDGAIASVHLLLHGACRTLIGLLSFDMRREFEDHTKSILRNSTAIGTALLYSLATLKILIEGSDSSSSKTRPEDRPEHYHIGGSDQGFKSDSVRSFFNGGKAHKTLQMLVMSVIWACNVDSDGSSDEAFACVELANEVISAIPSDVRLDWCSKNPAAVKKLSEKCALPKLASRLRFIALTFTGGLVHTAGIPSHLVPIFDSLLINIDTLNISSDTLDSCFDLAFKHFSPHIKSETWADLMDRALGYASDSDGQSILQSRTASLSVLERAEDVASDVQSMREGVSNAVATRQIGGKLRSFLLNSTPAKAATHTAGAATSCHSAVQAYQMALTIRICSFLLRVAFAASADPEPLPEDLLPLLVKKLGSCTSHQHQCNIIYRQVGAYRNELSLIESARTQQTFVDPANWRDRLTMTVQDEAERQKKSMLSTFAAICQDLEARCENAEAPVRAERERFIELENRHKKLKLSSKSTENQLLDRDLRISSLETDNEHLYNKLADASIANEQLLQRITDAELELRRLNETTRAENEAMRKQLEQKDLDKSVELAQVEEALDRVKEENQRLLKSSEWSCAEFDRLLAAQSESERRMEQQNDDMNKLQQALQESRDETKQVDQKRLTLTETSESVHQALETHRSLLAISRDECKKALEDLEQYRATSKQELRNVTTKLEARLGEAEDEWQERYMKLQQEFLAQESSYEVQVAKDKDMLHGMREKIERLKKDCVTKDAQVAEAQEMRNRLMNAMGLNTALARSPSKQASLPYRSVSTASTSYPEDQETPGRKMTPTYEKADALDATFDSSAASQHGPTPKRARPRKAFKVPALQQPPMTTGSRAAKAANRSGGVMKRQPFTDVSGNRSPPGKARSPSKEALQSCVAGSDQLSPGGREALAEWSFTTDLLTSTPGPGRGEFDGLDEESTADV